MIDFVITTYNRKEMLKRTVESLVAAIDVPNRIFIIDDCSDDGTQEYLSGLTGVEFVILSKKRNGVVYGFNFLWNMVDYYDTFYEEYPYLCYLQDDMVSKEFGWPSLVVSAYEELSDKYRIGFCSGYDPPEHHTEEKLEWKGKIVLLKTSSGACNLLAPKTYWKSIGQVPKFNPDGTPRGYPGGGKGSHIDLYLTGCMSKSQYVPKAAAENCSFNENRKVLIVPGMLLHEGQDPDKSTWRDERKPKTVGGRRVSSWVKL